LAEKTRQKICGFNSLAVFYPVLNMSRRQPKRSLSFHEKQNRFFAVSLVVLATIAFSVVVWLANRSSLNLH